MVSLFPHIKATTGGHACPITQVLDSIRAGKWRREVEAVRACPAGSKEYDAAKKCLPYFTTSGTFEHRANAGLLAHSGLMSLDLDTKHNPDTDWAATRAAIEADEHTYACFLSTGGAGLCVIVPVPTSHHVASFRALERYYLNTFGVKVDRLPDVCRARFISYDPALYHNPHADTFAELLEPEAPKPIPARAPAPAALPADPRADAETLLIAIGVKMVREAVDGSKHAKVRDAAYLLGGYVGSGYVDESRAFDALLAAVLAKENVASLRNAEEAIRSGLKKGAQRPILPDWLQYSARQEVRAAAGNPGVVLTLAHKISVASHVPVPGISAALDLIAEEQARQVRLLTFWNVTDPGQDKPLKVSLSLDKFTAWLGEEGFAKYRAGGDYATVRVVAGVVHEVDRGQLFDHVLGYLAGLPYEYDGIYGFQVRELVLSLERKLFDERFLQALPTLGADFVRDTATTAHYFFRNGWVLVQASGITLHDYTELPGLIWAEQVRAHEFRPLFGLEAKACDFHRFTLNVSGGQADRLALLRSALGYLLHGYKEEANAKCIIFVDEVATTGKPDGRTGKSLLIKAVGELVKVTTIPGATFRFEDSFRFQRIHESTRVAYFDEWDGRRLPFKKLFTEITTELAVNRKNHAEFTIPFERSPKFAITTNDVVSGEGGSHEGRKIEIPLAPHYSARHTPIDEFGRGFFADGQWDAEDWNYFFNLALGWVQDYLAAGRQLTQLASAALDARKLEDSTSPEFLEFAKEVREIGSGDILDPVLWADTMFQKFLAYSGEAQHRFPMRRFYQWMAKVGFMRKQWKGQGINRDKPYFEAPVSAASE
ncbi:BT4734/BF3469 family protein [Hymenobacter properus]|uniref:BT4734-like N-terminal domain-containing protein n=1 Tax=Hymenobacter properus TaxID=2791026 RepID=A0A931BBI3_9BACT|nr:BT4734/BF3469 family protein [Hymenobacter properus]MBF9140825.1 hypothetical protein [Hymenobacter properus]